jgi:hypothetical protein
MDAVVQARLDATEQKALAKLRRLGWSPSRAVREGLRLLAASQATVGRQRIAGLGKFASGVSDLGSNKNHMRGFGN